MRFKCRPDWVDKLDNWLDRKIEERDKKQAEWHDYRMWYGKVDGVCVLFEKVERKLDYHTHSFCWQDFYYWRYRLKEK